MLSRDYLHVALRDRAEQYLRTRHEDWYYGWVDTGHGTGHWMGQRHEDAARQYLHDMTERLDQARANAAGLRLEDDKAAYLDAQAALHVATCELDHARIRFDRVQQRISQAIEKRRALRIERLVTQLFLKYYRQAITKPWPLWGPGVPPALRRYILRWKDHPKIAPNQLVFLWVILDDTRQHADEFGVTAVGYQDWMANLELVTSVMDTDARESEPSKATRDFLRQLQYREPEPAHENYDPRDTRADLVYDGPAREDADDRCPTCQGYLRPRVIQIRGKYAQANACDRWATTCRYDLLTDLFATRDALHDHLAVHAMLQSL